MDRGRFDALARLVATQHSRRAALAAILGAMVLGRAPVATPAAPKRKGTGKKREQRRQRDHDDRVAGERRGASNRRLRKRRRRQQTTAEASSAKCCNRGNCAPGPGKNLAKCCFEGQDLAGRNFRGANLGSASFRRAILTSADFGSANLGQTCFVDADVSGARFGGANTGTAIFCRTTTSNGEDNSGCDRGTPCCPTCDDAHPCDEGELCCDGRCVVGTCCGNGEQSTCDTGEICCAHTCVEGECCRVSDCPEEVCQQRSYADNRCVYTPVFGERGPRCTTVCCRNEQEQPACCPDGTTVCTATGLCRCRDDQDCAAGEVCCDGSCETAIWANETTFGSGPGDGRSQFERIVGVAVDGGEETAWVVDQGNTRVSVWARQQNGDWDNETVFGTLGDGPGELAFPFGVAVPDDGLTALVGDQGNSRISVWTRQFDGSWSNPIRFGSAGDGESEFDRPTGVAVSGTGRTAWVADTGNTRVSVWTEASGFWTPQTTFGTGPGNDPGEFDDPVGVAVSGNGQTAWVVDRITTRVSVWNRQSGGSWVFDTEFGSFGGGPDQFRGPLGVAVSEDGQTAFVADLGNNRISIWARQPSGEWTHVENFGSGPGNGRDQFDGPSGLAVSADGRTVWVSDADNHRVSIWSLQCPAPPGG